METNFATLAEFSVLRQMGDLSDEGFAVFTFTNGTLCYGNERTRELLGLTSEEIFDLGVFTGGTILSSDRQFVRARLDAVRSGGTRIEFDFRAGTDEVRNLNCKMFPVMKGEYVVTLIRDVTREKQGNEHMIEFGSKKNMLLDALVHNLSGALGMMQNLTTQAIRDSNVAREGQAAKYLNLLNSNSRFCIDLINDLLINEHEQSHRTVAKKERFDVLEKINYVVEELRMSFSTKTFSAKSGAETPYVISDDVKILQVVVNLVSNAIKFTPENAEIKILIADHDKEFIRVEVSDDGIGIPEALQPHVFDRKSAAMRMGLNGEKSIGLGLAINKDLVSAIGGKLWMRSEENKGSTFYFTIPKN